MVEQQQTLQIRPDLAAQLRQRAGAANLPVEALLEQWLQESPQEGEPCLAGLDQVLEAVARGEPLVEILTKLIQVIEQRQPGLKASILLVDAEKQRLRHGVAPSLPAAYNAAIDGVKIGPQVGSCGTAVHERQLVIVTDIDSDPAWANFRDLAQQHQLRACWSQPIFDNGAAVLGTFALYYHEPRSPGPAELNLIHTAANIAGIAIRHAQTQAEQRQHEMRQQALLQAIPDLMFRHHRDGTFLDYYAAREEHLLVQPEQFLGRTATEVLPPELAETHMAHIAQVLDTGEPARYEYSLTLNGTPRQFEARMVAAGADEVVTIMRDITEQKELQAQAIALRVERERASLLQQFMQNASHELRTPLTVINTHLYLMAKVDDQQRREIYAERSKQQVIRLTRLLDMVLSMTKLDSGTPFVFEPGNINWIVERALAMAGPLIREKELALSYQPDPSLTQVELDPNWLPEAVQQLLDNAIRFTPAQGAIAVRTYRQDDHAVIEIADNGEGISEEDLPRIFERFWREDKARTTPGFGLGLPIVERIAAQHGGDVQVETAVDQGSTFRLRLPLKG
jgi:PAS domain S-box-containing protein